jgi:5-(carboxyamino)imidazole ribonucleotide synthase
MKLISPGATIGIIGGGQLGRFLAIAAANLGYKTHIYCPELNCPASQVANFTTNKSYSDKASIKEFAKSVDVITFEFENLPIASIEEMASITNVFPDPNILYIAKNRIREKEFATSCGAKVAKYRAINNIEEFLIAIKEIGYPSILKTAEDGYDGKGQLVINSDQQLDAAIVMISQTNSGLILEQMIHFSKEISVIIARKYDNVTKVLPIGENNHRNGILDYTIVPATISLSTIEQATKMALNIASKLNLVGLLAIEMFVQENGDILFNEMAPRPHNSGHYSLDACNNSQFDQHIKAICGLPLGNCDLLYKTKMTNLIGMMINDSIKLLNDPYIKLYIYGKEEVKEGRKMGHYTERLKD